MSNEFDAIGDIIQGTMIGRAVEPGAGEPSGHADGTNCLNCGAALIGSYCHACGQSAHVHRTMAAIFHDLLHGVAHFEGKVWRTVPQLVWRPGRLTREYIDGKRASHISPVALFLFVVFLTFAVFHAAAGDEHVNADPRKGSGAAASAIGAQIGGLEAQRRQAVATHQDTQDIDEQLSALRGSLALVRTTTPPGIGKQGAWGLSPHQGTSSHTGLVEAIRRAAGVAKANPDLALFKLQYNAYKYSWLLIPLSVPFVWLLFPFDRQFRAYDHTVFVTYSLSFMFLLVAVLTLCAVLASATLSDFLIPVLLLFVPFHMYRQLRETYALGRGSAALRTGLLAVFSSCVLVVWMIALLVMVTQGLSLPGHRHNRPNPC